MRTALIVAIALAIAGAAFYFYRSTKGPAETGGVQPEIDLATYAGDCMQELSEGNPINFPDLLQCTDGRILDIKLNNVEIPAQTDADSANFTAATVCDKPPILALGDAPIGQCVPNSMLQIGRADQPGVAHDERPYFALLCRNYEYRSLDSQAPDPQFDDVAMIVYSPRNQKTCFFQRLADTAAYSTPITAGRFDPQDSLSGTDIPSPFGPDADSFWDEPKVVKQIGCARCHDANPFVRTPYAQQVTGAAGLPPRTFGQAYGIVRLDYFDEPGKHEWKKYHAYFNLPAATRVDGGEGACERCHSIGPGQSSGDFTDYSSGTLADNQNDTGVYSDTHWMPPGAAKATWDAKFLASVTKMKACYQNPNDASCFKTLLH